MAQVLRPFYAALPQDVDPTDEKFIRAHDALQKVKSTFDNTNLEYERTLGYGGFGLAAKYAQKDKDGKHIRYVVVKAPLKRKGVFDPSSVKEEHEWYQMMKGMEHVPNLIDPLLLYKLPAPGSDEPAQVDRIYEFEKSSDYYLITEFLEHGELASLLERLNELQYDAAGYKTNDPPICIPNRLLWRIFLCLTRAVIAMAQPLAVKDWRARMKEQDPSLTEHALDEALEEDPYREHTDFGNDPAYIVHFDIDVYNVFLGQVKDPEEDQEHKYFKAVLGDYGLCALTPPALDRRILEQYAGYGKDSWRAPEQFLGMPADMDTWSFKTNLWGIGLVMCALMTKSRLSSDKAKKFCQDAVFTYPGGEKLFVPRTYGYFLGNQNVVDNSQFKQYDIDLRYTVASLMSQSLDMRGTLDLLYLTVKGQIDEGDLKAQMGELPAEETDEALRKFIDDHLINAPVSMFPAGALLDAPLPQANNQPAPADNQPAPADNQPAPDDDQPEPADSQPPKFNTI
ncbi:hypothetical protein PG990_012875 [Apiospora arundinis]